jgi:hypothetical protein
MNTTETKAELLTIRVSNPLIYSLGDVPPDYGKGSVYE